MKRKNGLSLLSAIIASLTVLSLAVCPLALTAAAEETKIVYVSENGNDTAAGTREAPLKTIPRAVHNLQNTGGEIVILGEIEVDGSMTFAAHEPLVLRGEDGGTINFTNTSTVDIKCGGEFTVDDLILKIGKYESSAVPRNIRFFPGGNRFTFGKDVNVPENFGNCYIVAQPVDGEENGIFVNGGSVGHIWLAESKGTGEEAYLTIADNGVVNYVYSGAASKPTSANTVVKVIDGGTLNNFTAAGQRADTTGDITLICMGGKIGKADGASTGSYLAKGDTQFYICTDDTLSPTEIKGFKHVFHFSSAMNERYSVEINKKLESPNVAVFKSEKAEGEASSLILMEKFTASFDYDESDELRYYLIPLVNYFMDDNFALLNGDKEKIGFERNDFGFIVNVFEDFAGDGYIAYDSSKGNPTAKETKEEVVLPPITKQEEEKTPATGETPSTGAPTTGETDSEKTDGEGVDVTLILVISLTAIIVIAGVVMIAINEKRSK